MTLEYHLQGLPTEKLLKIMRDAAAEYGIHHRLMPPRNASSADIIIMIEDLGPELGLMYDPAQNKIIEAKPALDEDYDDDLMEDNEHYQDLADDYQPSLFDDDYDYDYDDPWAGLDPGDDYPRKK